MDKQKFVSFVLIRLLIHLGLYFSSRKEEMYDERDMAVY